MMDDADRLREARKQIRIVREDGGEEYDSALELAEVLLSGTITDMGREHRLAGAKPAQQPEEDDGG
jgi:hypothetical protein